MRVPWTAGGNYTKSEFGLGDSASASKVVASGEHAKFGSPRRYLGMLSLERRKSAEGKLARKANGSATSTSAFLRRHAKTQNEWS